ncbi:hypothetical protein [Zhihengliuella halotolerans]|uniref:hypothetical protein n=1 Tax=Zhihengliuella halotolerans TaxID=370736 RepID=UPI0011AF2A18|nr:hypothetical protein [Zhihengliuella halotolerans]
MPNFLNLLAQYNSEHGVSATFSEMKKTARRIERAYSERADDGADPYEYVVDYADPTGETATDNVMTEQAARNSENAARRLAVAA